MTKKEAKEKLYMEWQKFLENNLDYAGISEAYKMAFKALEQEPSSSEKQNKWIPISERLPKCEQEVLICAERKLLSGKIARIVITTAFYEDGTMREVDSAWHWEEIDFERWDDEKDCGIIPEGWWEYRHYNPDEVYNNLVDDFILAWMPLPEPYKTLISEEADNEND